LLGTAGAAAWERTGSLVLAVISGVCCAIVATLITLCFAISFNLLFALRVDWQLREAFAASGMIDRAGFRVRNILEASSEILVRMPLLAICLAFAGAIIQAWMSRESRRALVLAARFLSSACVCNRCGRTVARQRDRTCCATTLCAIRSPAYRSCSVCCVSDWSAFHGSTNRV